MNNCLDKRWGLTFLFFQIKMKIEQHTTYLNFISQNNQFWVQFEGRGIISIWLHVVTNEAMALFEYGAYYSLSKHAKAIVQGKQSLIVQNLNEKSFWHRAIYIY